ncbi:G-protein alpha subunit [Flagelloscypha sp. PMI_526]|nr:G-protein alpha subunit [Flagelloscypha sp. PMI_526]
MSARRPMHAVLRPQDDTSDDPFIQFTHPTDETPEAYTARKKREEEAFLRSQTIDQELLETKRRLERKSKAIKILLLGQAESGKTSLLKNFQLCFCPSQFHAERQAWKYVIHLNIITSVKKIISTCELQWATTTNPLQQPTSPHSPTDLRRVIRSLQPLLALEDDLVKIMSNVRGRNNVTVPSGGRWKRLLSARRPSNASSLSTAPEDNPWAHVTINPDDSTQILVATKEDIITLWRSPVVADILHERGVRLKNEPGFFMDDVYRIARLDYVPTDADIVKARIQTMGVEEHLFTMEREGPDFGKEMFIVDVGGSRSMRNAWAPYFQDYNAIIFLAPLTFDLKLEEDPRVYRLEDSLKIWKDLCENKLLQNTTIIVLFNKKDILESTLAEGVQVVKHVPSFAQNPNDVEHVSRYFREKFKQYHKKLSPKRRPFIWHESNAIDIRSTGAILMGVHESILRKQLENSEIL